MRSLPNCWNRTLTQLGFQRKRNHLRKRTPLKRTPLVGRSRFHEFESLESRHLLAADVLVDTDLDTADGGVTTSIAALIATPGSDGISLREAIVAANNTPGANEIGFDATQMGGSTILMTVASGAFEISESLTIDGSNLTNRLTIDGNDPTAATGDGTQIFRILDSSSGATPPVVVFDTLHLTNADADSFQNGGAIYSEGLLTIRDSELSGNAASSGGAISTYMQGYGSSDRTVLEIDGTTIQGNEARSGYGGAISVRGYGFGFGDNTAESVSISSSSVITGNTSSSRGGAIYANLPTGSQLEITDSTVDGNTTSSFSQGGGIYLRAGTFGDSGTDQVELSVVNSSISGNTAGSSGGGIFAYGYDDQLRVTLSSATIDGNDSSGSGGGVYFRQSSFSAGAPLVAFISSTSISDNDALQGSGGAIYVANSSGGVLNISDSTLDRNTASSRGGATFVNLSGGTTSSNIISVTDSSLSDNDASSAGGGLYLRSSGGGSLSIISSSMDINTAGGNGGGAYANLSGGTADAEFVVLDSSLSGNTTSSGSGGGLYLHSNTTAANVNVADSYIDGNGSTNRGGGVYFRSSFNGSGVEQFSISNSSVTGNSTTNRGGGIFHYSSTRSELTVSGSDIDFNTASSSSSDGGGLYAAADSGSTLSISSSSLDGNSVGSDGGGVFLKTNFSSTPVSEIVSITATTISGNTATNGRGGGIYHRSQSSIVDVSLAAATIQGNASGSQGGGLYSHSDSGSTLSVSNSTIDDNTSVSHGGGVFLQTDMRNPLVPEVVTVTSSSIFGNTASNGQGGGIYHKSESPFEMVISQSEISSNIARGGSGGGIFTNVAALSESTLTIAQTTISDNEALDDGGGLYVTFPEGDYTDFDTAGVFISDTLMLNNISGADGIDNDTDLAIDEPDEMNRNANGGAAFIRFGPGSGAHEIAKNAKVEVARTLISGNVASNRGGGLYLYGAGGAEFSIVNSRVSGNTTGLGYTPGLSGESPNSGGGVYMYLMSGPPDQTSTASGGGNGGDETEVARLTISGTTVDANVAGQNGGGIFVCAKRGGDYSSAFSMDNSTVSGNTAGPTPNQSDDDGEGGGIHLAVWPGQEDEGLVSEFRNVTVTENTAGLGGGIYSNVPSFLPSVVDTRMMNTIVSGNREHDDDLLTDADGDGDPTNDGAANNFYGSINFETNSLPVTRYNLIGPGSTFIHHDSHLPFIAVEIDDFFDREMPLNSPLNGNIDNTIRGPGLENDPGLEPLANNRGTVLLDGSVVPTHATEYESLAQDGGSNALAIVPFSDVPVPPGTSLVSDQRGADRFVDIPLVGGTTPGFTVDIGAHECDPDFLPGDYNADGFVDAADYSVWRDNLGAYVVPFSGADGNGDGVINTADYQIWRSHYGALPGDSCNLDDVPLPGDYNSDGVVNAADYSVWRDNLGASIVLPNDTTPGTVTSEDYDVWRNNFGATLTLPANASAPGDYDRDGTVDEADYDVWLAALGSESDLYADGNDNGIVDIADLAVWQEYRGVTTVDDFSGDYNSNGVVDQADYQLWSSTFGSTTELAADGNGNGTIDAGDYTIWRDNLGTTNASVFPMFVNGSSQGVPLEVPMAAPQVIEVSLSGSSSMHLEFDFSTVDGSGEQLRSVPVGGVDTLSVQFSEEVFVLNSDLGLVNVQTGTPAVISSYSYDLANQTAIWQLGSPLDPGQYLITLNDSIIDLDQESLDGEYSNPWAIADPAGTASTLPSGDGEAGGEFRFRFTILDGDYNGDNAVNAADYTVWADNNGLTGATSTRQGDGNGDGTVDSSDHNVWTSQFGFDLVNWPSIEPGAILVSTLIDEDDGDHSFGDLSLREALGIAATNAGHDTIEFQYGLAVGTISLNSTLGQLVVDSDVTIQGLGIDDLTVSGGNAVRVFRVNTGVQATFADFTIADGLSGTSNGGGIYSTGDLVLDGMVLEDNAAGPNVGGAIYASAGSLSISESTFRNNTARLGGGIRLYMSSITDVSIENSTFHGNRAEAGTQWAVGGAIFAQYGNSSNPIRIYNSTFSDNFATNAAGAIRGHTNTHFEIVNSTIYDNHAVNNDGGGLSFVAGAKPLLQNTIVAGNTAPMGANTYLQSGLLAGSANNLIGGDPKLTPLGDFGGPTLTHRLLPGSPAIDAGDNALAVDANGEAFLFDQRGRNRFVNTVDIGAVEQELLGDYNGDGSVNTSDYSVWRDHLGSTSDLVADGDSNGIVDSNDYQIWKDHFGSTPNGTPLSAQYNIQLVSSATDENDGDHTFGNHSLREALANAASTTGEDMIVFRQELDGQTITLSSSLGELSIDSDTNIVARGADLLTIDAAGASRIVNVQPNVAASISGLKLTGGVANEGGGIYSQGDLTLDSVVIAINSASSGGGIYQSGGSLTIDRSTIDSNTASFAGGGVVASGVDSVSLTSSTISRNQSPYVGGFWANDAEVDFVNTTISTNTASNGFGGGAYFSAPSTSPRTATLTNVTVANNSAGTGSGGGIYVSGSYVDVTLNNTLVAGNTSNIGADDVFGSFNSLSAFNLIGAIDGATGLGAASNLTGTRAAVLDAGLTALGDHGGLTETHALLDGSSAVDAGDDALASVLGITTDQRGEDRFDDGDGDTLDQIDIGAFELGADEYFGTI